MSCRIALSTNLVSMVSTAQAFARLLSSGLVDQLMEQQHNHLLPKGLWHHHHFKCTAKHQQLCLFVLKVTEAMDKEGFIKLSDAFVFASHRIYGITVTLNVKLSTNNLVYFIVNVAEAMDKEGFIK